MLTKSKYLSGLQCIRKLWLSLHHPEEAAPLSPFQEMVLQRGTEIGERARGRFPEGLLIQAAFYEHTAALEETAEAVGKGASCLFEAAFVFEETFIRADIIKKTGSGAWDIIEVKSTLDVQDIQLPDAAVQRYVAEGSGLPVHSVYIMHLNRRCEYPRLENLFDIEDVSQLILPELESVSGNISLLQSAARYPEEPDVRIGDHCLSPRECAFKQYCWSFLKRPSVFDIPRMNKGRREDLLSRSIYTVAEIPPDYPLSKAEREHTDLYTGGKPRINREMIQKQLDSLQYPLYFLDFETDNPAVPRFPGTHPYGQVPFQYSLHILRGNSTLDHREYLHTGTDDPRQPLARKLIRDIGKRGTVIAYSAGFEKRVITSLAEFLPGSAEALLAIIPRFRDLLDIFRKYYKDPRFFGSNSLKAVLPVLVPSMTYSGMDVSNGTEAQLAWNMLLQQESGEIEQALREYCRQDTLAMVEIYNILRGILRKSKTHR